MRIPRPIRTAAEETLRENDAIEAILLYGSRARGDQSEGAAKVEASPTPRNLRTNANDGRRHPGPSPGPALGHGVPARSNPWPARRAG